MPHCCAQDSLFYGAASSETGLVTAGAQERHLPDYERFWRERLAKRFKRGHRMPAGVCWAQQAVCQGGVKANTGAMGIGLELFSIVFVLP